MDAYGLTTFKPLLYGYILVTPNTTEVQKLVEKLNDPLKFANFFKDNVVDFNKVADSLQDAISESDFRKAASVSFFFYKKSLKNFIFKIISTLLPPSNETERIQFLLEHLFNNASDPYALLEMVKNVTDKFENFTQVIFSEIEKTTKDL